jgi:hypothetical protein
VPQQFNSHQEAEMARSCCTTNFESKRPLDVRKEILKLHQEQPYPSNWCKAKKEITLNNRKHKTRNVPQVHITNSLKIFTIQHTVRLSREATECLRLSCLPRPNSLTQFSKQSAILPLNHRKPRFSLLSFQRKVKRRLLRSQLPAILSWGGEMRRLRAGFSPQGPGFDSTPAHVKFLVGKKEHLAGFSPSMSV